MKALLASLMISLIIGTGLVLYHIQLGIEPSSFRQDVYVGVTFCSNTTQEAKLLVNRVKNYTNLFVIDSLSMILNETALNEVCDYVVDSDMSFIVWFGAFYRTELPGPPGVPPLPWHIPWLDSARERWGDRFLGIYLYDEPGGHQLDTGKWRSGSLPVMSASDYGDAAGQFTSAISNSIDMRDLKKRGITAFTSDYVLYWFDCLAGYDCVFAEFCWNHSRIQNVALCRGAANMQNKQWGAIVTWTYRSPPYLESGEELFRDMVTAYRAGAKYIIVFNYPKINPYGILTDEHFHALRDFWNYINRSQRGKNGVEDGQVALVLPKDYGWGIRNMQDRIWGLWPPDDLSPQIWSKMNNLIAEHGLRLDIVYDDPQFSLKGKYSKLYAWNGKVN